MNIKHIKAIMIISFGILCLSLCGIGYFAYSYLHPSAPKAPDAGYSISSDSGIIISDDIYAEIPQGAKELIFKNEDKNEIKLSFSFSADVSIGGEKLPMGETEQIILSAGEEKKLSFSCGGAVKSEVFAESKSFIFDNAGFIKSQEEKTKAVVLFPEEYERLDIKEPISVYGDYSASKIYAETEKNGEIIISSERQFECGVFFYAPECDIYLYGAKPDFAEEKRDLFITARSFMGKDIKLYDYPIYEESDMDVLQSGKLIKGGNIIFKEEFSFGKDRDFDIPLNFSFLAKPNFGEYKIRINYGEKGSISVFCGEGISVPSESFEIDAPKCELIWSGNAPLFEIIDMYQNVAKYQGEETTLGGDGEKQSMMIALRASDNPAIEKDIIFKEYKNTFFGEFPYSAVPADFSHIFLDIEADHKYEFEKTNEDGSIDLSSGAVIISFDENGGEYRHILTIKRSENSIPVIYISTYGGEEIDSKTVYKDAVFSISAANTDYEKMEPTHIRIRGRGNSTWKWEKKPYKIHFDMPTSVFGLPAAEEWALFSNYADKSLMRNRVALEMARELSFDYVPTQILVDVFVNGEYEGVYTFGEHYEAGEGRVEIDGNAKKRDCGFFLEAGGVVAGVDIKGMNYFHAGLIKFVLIKSPDYEYMTSSQFGFIKNYVQKINDTIIDHSNYEDYIDVDSLIDWMIMTELTNNTDCAYRRSTFMTKNTGEKLKMACPWDFDLAFGNFSKDVQDYSIWASSNPDDDYVGTTWTTHLLEDDNFKAKFKARWQEVRDTLIERANAVIDESYDSVYASAMENFDRWDVLGHKVAFERKDTYLYPTFDSQITYLKDFIEERADFIDSETSLW